MRIEERRRIARILVKSTQGDKSPRKTPRTEKTQKNRASVLEKGSVGVKGGV